jgi:general secretion pathway protein A
MRALFQRSGGIPRLINIIADRALAGAYALETSRVNARLVQAAASEVQPSESRMQGNRRPEKIALAAVVLLLVVLLFLWGLPALNLKTGFPAATDGVASQVAANPDAAKTGADLPVQPAGAGETVPSGQGMGTTMPEHPPTEDFASPKMESVVGGGASSAAPATTPAPLIFTPPPGAAANELDPQWLAEQSMLSWQGLAEAWQDGKRVNALRVACDGQVGTGYACLHIQGNWGKILRLGLPVILVLQGDIEYQLLLTGIDQDRLLVGSGAQRKVVDRNALDSKWLGEYIVAWPQAPDWPAQVQRGEAGPAVAIVMQMARLADPPWTGEAQFDAGFESWLFDFQRRQGLIPDGIVGPQTLLYLMAPTITEPRLVVNLKEGF